MCLVHKFQLSHPNFIPQVKKSLLAYNKTLIHKVQACQKQEAEETIIRMA